MREYEIKKVQFRVTDFLNWQRDGSLVLNPEFQRRSVWNSNAKSLFIDTVVRGLPAPIIYLREKIDLNTHQTKREIVDGQQRLRTVISFIDYRSLDDYDPKLDDFTVKKTHNNDIANKKFEDLKEKFKKNILSYEFSTHVLPINVEDREVLEMFARLNSTGVKLNQQELRNAEYFGEFKSIVYRLALEQYERWINWKVFTASSIARMKEVELTSDLCINMLQGLTTKNQKTIDNIYKKYDEVFEEGEEIQRRFRKVMDQIDELLPHNEISQLIYNMEIHFFTLFIFLYDLMFGLESTLQKTESNRIKSSVRKAVLEYNEIVNEEKFQDPEIEEAIENKRADSNRRELRLKLMNQVYAGTVTSSH